MSNIVKLYNKTHKYYKDIKVGDVITIIKSDRQFFKEGHKYIVEGIENCRVSNIREDKINLYCPECSTDLYCIRCKTDEGSYIPTCDCILGDINGIEYKK